MRRARCALSQYLDQAVGFERGEHRFQRVVVVARAGRVTYFERPKAARVAQLDRVTASGAAGCGFNSRHAHHSRKILPVVKNYGSRLALAPVVYPQNRGDYSVVASD